MGSLEMSWKVQDEVEEWLVRSAISVLKDFSDVNSVNLKLEARGFEFTSIYLCGKCAVWTFESEMERDGFVRSTGGETHLAFQNVKSTTIGRKSKGKGNNQPIKIHPMNTRKSRLVFVKTNKTSQQRQRKKGVWNLEEEFAKVIQKGVALGIIKKKDDKVEWDLDEEVTKVLETGATLGIDFDGNKEELYDVVVGLERKGEARRVG
ncbi:hypothetical protein LWI28_002123 [Acer negundo]|uniref:Uncharacterized protein n=1 Tax=Acer negundo TaxID=4023 RepID=A0AAD5ILG4_ACENE|nr:hypothetical protein LWI28_002123 [Acer negundo]